MDGGGKAKRYRTLRGQSTGSVPGGCIINSLLSSALSFKKTNCTSPIPTPTLLKG